MVNAYSQGKGCRLDDTPHHLPTRRNYTTMVGEDVHEDLIALDQRRTNRLTVAVQSVTLLLSSLLLSSITNQQTNYTTSRSSCPRVALYTISQDSTCIVPKYHAKGTPPAPWTIIVIPGRLSNRLHLWWPITSHSNIQTVGECKESSLHSPAFTAESTQSPQAFTIALEKIVPI